jgi:hypothetical protein
MHDHTWLYNAPACPGAVAWSEENILAVAAGHTVVLLAPGYLDGPRGFAVARDGSAASAPACVVDGAPAHFGGSAAVTLCSLFWGGGGRAAKIMKS